MMEEKSKPQSQITLPFDCGHCGNQILLELDCQYSQPTTVDDLLVEKEWQSGTFWEFGHCPICSGRILRQVDWHEHYFPNEWHIKILYPPLDNIPSGLPPNIEKAYHQAIKIRRINSNAFAVLLGRVLDMVCIDKNATGDSLNDRINYLSEKGEIPSKLATMAHQLRQLRNIGAHADLGELSAEEVPILDDLCTAILEYLYTAPQLTKRIEQRIKDLKNKTT